MHIVNNVVMQLALGILLELVHKWWRVLVIYFVGVLAGSLATSSKFWKLFELTTFQSPSFQNKDV